MTSVIRGSPKPWMVPDPPVLEISLTGLPADLAMLDAIARLVLAARLRGARVALTGASSELTELIELAGLGDSLHG